MGAFQRSREVADSRANGGHYLMRKNGITEGDGWGTFVDDHILQVALSDGGSETLTFDHCVIATSTTTRRVALATTGTDAS